MKAKTGEFPEVESRRRFADDPAVSSSALRFPFIKRIAKGVLMNMLTAATINACAQPKASEMAFSYPRDYVSAKTIEVHRVNIKQKLNMGTAPELIHFAVRWMESQKPE